MFYSFRISLMFSVQVQEMNDVEDSARACHHHWSQGELPLPPQLTQMFGLLLKPVVTNVNTTVRSSADLGIKAS